MLSKSTEAPMRCLAQALVVATLSGPVSAIAVTNELAQSANEKPNDVQLQTAIAEAMHTSPLTANSLIVVHVNQGEVTLEGAATSPLARREATRLAETVLGVKGIRNRLSVVNTQTAEIPPER
jgi:osmotically-inducible protein OsmY